MTNKFIDNTKLNELKITFSTNLPNVIDIQCDHVSSNVVIYHAKWEKDGQVGWSIVKGDGDVKACFQAIQDRCILDSFGKQEWLTEYEYGANAYRVSFGRFKGYVLEDVPRFFIEHWAMKDPDEFKGDMKDFVLKCQETIA